MNHRIKNIFLSLFRTRRRRGGFFGALALISILASAIPILAAPPTSPYAPGETLDPSCAPGDTNCTVNPPLTGNGTSTQITFYSTATTTMSDPNLTWATSTTLLSVLGTVSSTQLRTPSSTITNLTLAGITGSTQCLQVNSAGLVSGTASACGSGSGSGFTRSDPFVYLATSTDLLGIGATSTAKLTIQSSNVGSSTVNILGLAGQTANIFNITSSTAATSYFSVNAGGQIAIGTSTFSTDALLTIATGTPILSVLTNGQLFFGNATNTISTSGTIMLPAGVTSSTGINFGDASTNLYRSGASTLRTDSGTFNLGGASYTGSSVIAVSGSPYTISGNRSAGTAASNITLNHNNGPSFTSGSVDTVNILSGTFAPTSGTGVLNALHVQSIINQLYGSSASGITRGISINPTLTSAYDFRQLEVGTSTSGGTVWNRSTSTTLTNGYSTLFNAFTLSIGTSTAGQTASITNAYNVAINGAPIATVGSSSITNSYGLGILTSNVTASTTNAIGLFVQAPTGATNLSAARFDGIPQAAANSSLVLLGSNYLSGGNANGTFLGANPTSTFSGDFANFQIGSSTTFLINSSGSLAIATGTPATDALLTIATSSSIFTVNANGKIVLGNATNTPALGGTMFFPLGTTSSTGINFGDATANLYRSAASSIKTDSTFNVGNLIVASGNIQQQSAGLIIRGNAGSSSGANVNITETNNSRTYTSGNGQSLLVAGGGVSFIPTSGTGVYNALEVQGAIINQLYGSNSSGITRGLIVSSTLTSAYDFRALEIGNANGGLTWNRSTSTTLTNGYSALFNAFTLSIGTSTATSTAITNAYNLAINGAPIATVGSSSITNSYGLGILTSNVSASTTNSYGLLVQTMTGATNNYGAAFTGSSSLMIATSTPYGATSTLTVCAKSNCTTPTTASSTDTVAFFASTGGATTDTSIVARGVITSGLADIGEYINVVGNPESYAAGEVLMVSPSASGTFERALRTHNALLAGVVTKTAGFVAGGGEDNHGSVIMALAGRVPVIVSAENGAITIGDELTASSQAGVAMKATDPGKVIGMALDDWNPSAGSQPSQSSGGQAGFPASPATGTVMMLAQNHFSLGTPPSSSGQGMLGGLTAMVAQAFQKLGATIANGVATLKEVIVDKLITKELCLEDVCVNKTQLQQILNQSGAPASPPPPAPPPVAPPPAPAPEPPPAGGTDPALEPVPEPEPAPEPTPPPAPTPAPAPAPEPEPEPAPTPTE